MVSRHVTEKVTIIGSTRTEPYTTEDSMFHAILMVYAELLQL